jgi:hypothetical protein
MTSTHIFVTHVFGISGALLSIHPSKSILNRLGTDLAKLKLGRPLHLVAHFSQTTHFLSS